MGGSKTRPRSTIGATFINGQRLPCKRTLFDLSTRAILT